MNKSLIILLVIIALLIGYFGYRTFSATTGEQSINNFEDCVAAGNTIMESYPRQCKTSDERTFTEVVDTPNSVEGAPSGSLHNLPVPEAVNNIRMLLSRRQRVDENQVVIMEAIETDWPDSCLGISEQGMACSQVITPGYRIVAIVNGKEFIFRTNTEGSIIKEESAE